MQCMIMAWAEVVWWWWWWRHGRGVVACPSLCLSCLLSLSPSPSPLCLCSLLLHVHAPLLLPAAVLLSSKLALTMAKTMAAAWQHSTSKNKWHGTKNKAEKEKQKPRLCHCLCLPCCTPRAFLHMHMHGALPLCLCVRWGPGCLPFCCCVLVRSPTSGSHPPPSSPHPTLIISQLLRLLCVGMTNMGISSRHHFISLHFLNPFHFGDNGREQTGVPGVATAWRGDSAGICRPRAHNRRRELDSKAGGHRNGRLGGAARGGGGKLRVPQPHSGLPHPRVSDASHCGMA